MRESKVAYPAECASILVELKKGKIRKKDLVAMFKDEHADYNLDVMARNGLIKRSYVTENGHDMIYYEFSGDDSGFKQGQNKYPEKKGGMFV